MQATALTLTLVGLEARPIRVEVDSGRGPSAFQLVGLAEASVRESRVRVRSALQQIGVDLDEFVITVNLAPADLRKNGGAFDVAIAVAALAAIGKLPARDLEGIALLGELSLTGSIRSVRGVLPALVGARKLGVQHAIVPAANAREAASVGNIAVGVADHLSEIVAHFRKGAPLRTAESSLATGSAELSFDTDLMDVRGQYAAKRALEIAAAGGHNLLFMGPPGSGKTMLARRVPSVMPPLTPEEAIEITAIHSVAGLLPPERGLVHSRPFRAPHHTVSVAGLVGGGSPPRPGEVSLAHHGCLFLDELLEFRGDVLEALRQPLEDGVVTVCRARSRATFPARPMLVAAVNPCPCGLCGVPGRRGTCTPERVRSYRAKLSGPMLDRIDLQIALPPVELRALQAARSGESSATVRDRVCKARSVQLHRHASGAVHARINAELTSCDLDAVGGLDAGGQAVLASAVERLGLSARAYAKVLRVARTIADLDSVDAVRASHVAEAISLRLLDRPVDLSKAPVRLALHG